MLDTVRFQLLYGPYRPPRCRVGKTWLRCAIRGPVRVVGISDAPIPWPLCKTGKHLVPIVCGRLVMAVKRESNLAVEIWWGISCQTVTMWRKTLVVGKYTKGTLRLHREWAPETITDGVRAPAMQTCKSPAYSEKQRKLRTGKPRPQHVLDDAGGRRKVLGPLLHERVEECECFLAIFLALDELLEEPLGTLARRPRKGTLTPTPFCAP